MKILKISVIGLSIIRDFIHFGDDKTKSVLIVTKFKIKKVRKPNIKYRDIYLKHPCHTLKRCVYHETLFVNLERIQLFYHILTL